MRRTVAIIVFGAKVKEDGSPSETLKLRVYAALQACDKFLSPILLLTGGEVNSKFTEAIVAKELLLEAGFSEDRILVETKAKNTIESVINCSKILKNYNDKTLSVYVCSSNYHVFRCSILLKLVDIKIEGTIKTNEFGIIGNKKILFYYLKEFPALIKDLANLFFRKMRSFFITPRNYLLEISAHAGLRTM